VNSASVEPLSGRGEVRIRDTAAQDRAVDLSPRRRRRLWVVAAAVAAMTVGGLVAWPSLARFASAERSVPLERLRLATVTRGEFVRDVAVRGRVVAAVKPTVYAPADGTVTLAVQAGDTVPAGAVLATLDSPELTSELEQERATLDRLVAELTRQGIQKKQQELANQQTIDMARVEIQAAERELRRAETSWDQQIISLQDYEKARDDLARAELEYAHARQKARLESESLAFELQTRELERDRQQLKVTELERRVTELSVRSPVAGMIGALAVEQKANVAENQPLMTVVDLSAYEIEIRVPQEYGDDLALGMPAEIKVGPSALAGTITAISPEVEENQVRGRVRFDGESPAGLRQNQRVSARVLLESRADTLTVPRGPFLDSGAGRVAYVLDDGLARRRPIQVGAASIGDVEILAGLEEGQTIIISDLAQFDGAETVLMRD
jgi:HlyD family secretion protein